MKPKKKPRQYRVNGTHINPMTRVMINDASMCNALMSSEDVARELDCCCGIHGAMRERRGAKKATSAARRRYEKEIIERELKEFEDEQTQL